MKMKNAAEMERQFPPPELVIVICDKPCRVCEIVFVGQPYFGDGKIGAGIYPRLKGEKSSRSGACPPLPQIVLLLANHLSESNQLR